MQATGLLSRLARESSAVLASSYGNRAMTTPANGIYDVIIVGGGLVGSAMAAGLSSNPWTQDLKVAVLDRQAPPEAGAPLSDVPELRVSTITPQTVSFLQRCIDWQDVAPPRSAPFSTMQVWDWGGNGFVKYHASDVGADQIGYVAENSVLLTAFLRRLEMPGRPNIFEYPASIKNLALPVYSARGRTGSTPGSPLAVVELENGETLKANLVIGADGAKSQVRELAELRVKSFAYDQQGLVASVKTQVQNNTAHQRFLETGPLAVLPVRGGYSNIVWSTSPEHAQQLESLGPQEFASAVNKALHGGQLPVSGGNSLSSFEDPPIIEKFVGVSPKSFPLMYSHTGRYVRARLALIGDAAHTIHPLAGQGVNLGFGDVDALVSTLAHAVEHGRDLGERALLLEYYERPRQKANQRMMTACDSLLRIYRPQSGYSAMLRGKGLELLNSSATAKEQIMRYAMGV